MYVFVYLFMYLQNDKIPEDLRQQVVEHVVHVHLSVGQYSKEFLAKLRRINHVTPKNYLDFINTYTKLLQEKDKFVQDQVMFTHPEPEVVEHIQRNHCMNIIYSLSVYVHVVPAIVQWSY